MVNFEKLQVKTNMKEIMHVNKVGILFLLSVARAAFYLFHVSFQSSLLGTKLRTMSFTLSVD